MREIALAEPIPERTRSSLDGPGRPEPQRTERWAAVVGGAALIAYAAKQRSWKSVGLAVAGAPLVYRGATGRWPALREPAGAAAVRVETSLTVERPREDLYRFWRRLENLPRFMKNLESVEETGGGRSRWVGRSPLGLRVQWEAEIVEEREGHYVSWRSLPGSQLEIAGSVLFEDATGGRGTVVRVTFDYRLPGAAAGRAFARLTHGTTELQVEEDLRRFKNLMEAGEAPTIAGQPTGARPADGAGNGGAPYAS